MDKNRLCNKYVEIDINILEMICIILSYFFLSYSISLNGILNDLVSVLLNSWGHPEIHVLASDCIRHQATAHIHVVISVSNLVSIDYPQFSSGKA